MSISPSFRPKETDAQIFSEHTWLQGAFLVSVAYGVVVVMFLMSFRSLYRQRKRHDGVHNLHLLAYILVVFLLSTLYTASILLFTQDAFIDNRNMPGGPSSFEILEISLPINMLGNVAFVLLAWMCDLINVWRCVIIYQNCHLPTWVVCFVPVGTYLVSVAVGITWLRQLTTTPWLSPASAANLHIVTLPYYAILFAQNILVSAFIVGRLILYRFRIAKIMGTKHVAPYTSIVTMVVESALFYSSLSLLFLIPWLLKNPVSQTFLQLWSPAQTIAALLIIFRVAQAKTTLWR